MTVVHWARHGENVANLSRTFSYRVFDSDLTERGIAQAIQEDSKAQKKASVADAFDDK